MSHVRRWFVAARFSVLAASLTIDRLASNYDNVDNQK